MYRPEHENLEVYHRALEAAHALETVARSIPDFRMDLRDQLRRASSSMVLNLAEGASEFSAKDKARFYRMSRRSAAECLAILDLAGPMLVVPAPEWTRQGLLLVMASLDKLAHAVHRRP